MRALILAHLAALAAPAAAQGAPDRELLAGLGRLGATIYALDRAAWVASDAMTAKLPRHRRRAVGPRRRPILV